MRTRAAPRLQLFLALATGCVLLLSLAWIWLGVAYVGLLLRLVAPLLPAAVELQQHGQEIQFLAQGATGGSVRAGMHGMMMSYGLILATSVLLTMPSLNLRVRLSLIALAILTAFAAHLVGIYLLAQRIDSIFHRVAATGEFSSLAGTLTYLWLFIPSLVWLPLLLWQLWPRRRANLRFDAVRP